MEITVSHSGSEEGLQDGLNRDSDTTVSHSGSECASNIVGMFILRLQFRILDYKRASIIVGIVVRRLQFRILDQSRALTMVGILFRQFSVATSAPTFYSFAGPRVAPVLFTSYSHAGLLRVGHLHALSLRARRYVSLFSSAVNDHDHDDDDHDDEDDVYCD